MNPTYPLGGTFAAGSIWKAGKSPSPLPLTVDYLANPDLFAIVVLAFLALVLAALLWAAWRRGHPASRSTPCEDYVKKWEAAGYEMDDYRARCGMPALHHTVLPPSTSRPHLQR
jgi:hypothetical protein